MILWLIHPSGHLCISSLSKNFKVSLMFVRISYWGVYSPGPLMLCPNIESLHDIAVPGDNNSPGNSHGIFRKLFYLIMRVLVLACQSTFLFIFEAKTVDQ